jgi:hypothetical protein
MSTWPEEIEEYKQLFIPSTGVGGVYICSNATSLDEVSLNNADFIIKVGETKNGMIVSTTFFNGREYYLVSGVTGTGGGEIKEAFLSYDISLYGTFTPDGIIQSSVQVTNTFNTSKSLLVTIQVLDPDGIPIFPVYQWITVEAFNTQKVTLSIDIATTATKGSYLVQVQILTGLPRDGGYAIDYKEEIIVIM